MMRVYVQAEPQPDNDEHEMQVAAINEDIKKIKSEIEVFKSKIDAANEARRGQGVRREEQQSLGALRTDYSSRVDHSSVP